MAIAPLSAARAVLVIVPTTSMRRSPPTAWIRYALDELRWVTIGGFPQAVHVLARSPSAPVLLFLHGGPGVPHMPFTYMNAALANSFVVVHWDQRGAGKTFCASPNRVPRSLAELVADASDVVEWLCTEFRQDKITLVGHSCGSALGALVAARYPQRVRAFVGVGQITDLQSAECVRYGMVSRIASRNRDRASLRRLHELGPPPYRGASGSDELEAVAATVTGDFLDPFTDARFGRVAMASGLCAQDELPVYAAGTRYSQQALWPEFVNHFELQRQVPRFEVPVAFIVGSRDLFAPSVLAEEYFHRVRTSHGKVLCRLDGVGHWPHLQAPVLYRAALAAVIAACAR